VGGIAGNRRGLAYDGSTYWAGSSNTNSTYNLVEYNTSGFVSGNLQAFPIHGIGADLAGEVYAFHFNTGRMYQLTAPGVLTLAAPLSGGTLPNPGYKVIVNQTGTEFLGFDGAQVNRWSMNGTFLGFTPLVGLGTQPGEAFPGNLSLAAGNGVYYTMGTNSVVSTWSLAGNRIAQDTLAAGFGAFEGPMSFSMTNNMFFVNNGAGTWMGFATPVPEPGTLGLLGAAVGVLWLRRRR